MRMKNFSNSVFTRPFTIYLRPTNSLKLLIWIPHLIALLIIIVFWIISTPVLVPLDPWFFFVSLATSVLAILGIAFSFIYYSRLHVWKSLDHSICEITQDSTKNWMVGCRGKENHEVELLPSSFISTFLMVLNFKGLDNRSYTTVIVPNTLPDQYFRHLLIRVKMS